MSEISTPHPYAAIRDLLDSTTDLKAEDRLVLLSIMVHTGRDGTAVPTVPTIAKHTGQSVRSVQRAIPRLVEGGRLKRLLRKGTSAIYRVVIAAGTAVQSSGDNPRHDSPEVVTSHATSGDRGALKPNRVVDFEVDLRSEEKPSRKRTNPKTETPAPKKAGRRGWFRGKPLLPTSAECCPVRGHERYFAATDAAPCLGCAADERAAAVAAERFRRDASELGYAVPHQRKQSAVKDDILSKPGRVRGVPLAERLEMLASGRLLAREAVEATLG